MKRIDEIIKKIDALKPISQVAHRVMEIADSPDTAITELVDLVQYDPALTANLLKICNSAYYGLSVHVDSVRHAVNLLGTDKLIELVLMKSSGENLLKAQKGYGLQAGELWKHSVASALLAKSFARKNNPNSDQFLIYTAALLRDIGKVIIESHVGRSIGKIRHLVEKKGYGFDEAEAEIIGIDHARLGGMIAGKWNFSPRMTFLIANHHLTDPEAREDLETSVVYLADTVSRMALAGIGADGLAYKVYDAVFDSFGVTETDIRYLAGEYQANLQFAERLLPSIQEPGRG